MSRPITFQNNKQPCLNAENLNKMQDELNMFRNLLNIPDGTYTHNGVTYIAKNGVLTYSSGTATSDVNIGINITPFTLKSGTYTMSNNSGNYPYIMLFSGDTKVVESEYADNGVKTFTIENEKTINKVHLYFGQSTPPASVKPQVEENTTATSYVPYIPDNVMNIINETKKNYSIDEKKIGTWINGKPIYQKTFTYTPDLASRCLYQHGISNIDQIINSEAMLQKTNGRFVPLSMVYPNATDLNTLITWSSGYQITKTDIETWIGNSMFEQMDTTNYGIIVTIQYTKTTD